MREQVLVENRDFQERNLQAAEQRLHLRRQIAILQDEFEQHADEVDRIFVGAGDVGFALPWNLPAWSSSSCFSCCTHLRGIGDVPACDCTMHRLVLQNRQRP